MWAYGWRLWKASWAFTVPAFFNRLTRTRISFGLWIRVTTDNIVQARQLANVASESENDKDERPYSYRPLENMRQIRLLRLHWGSFGEPLRAAFEVHSLNAVPAYCALSYVWGSGGDGHIQMSLTINDDGDDNLQTLPLRSNLHKALADVRSSLDPSTGPSSLLVWADALCINQIDIEERKNQVQMMAEIYKYAAEVFVWLGEPDQTSDVGLAALEYFVNPAIPEVEAPWYFSQVGGSRCDDEHLKQQQEVADGLQGVLDRAWWSRIWTVQEAALASRVRLFIKPAPPTSVPGSTAKFVRRARPALAWQTDLRTLQAIKFRIKTALISAQWQQSVALAQVDLRPLLEVVESQMRERAADKGRQLEKDLLDVVYEFRHRKSTDPRDKIIAVLGLAEGRRTNFEQSAFAVDYSVSVEEIQERFKAALEQSYPDVDIVVPSI